MANKLAKLQFFGPTAILIGVGAAEGAAWALAHVPSSEILWYVNLKIFGIFQIAYYILVGPTLHLPYSQLFIIAIPLFSIAAYGFFTRRMFLLAVSSNLSFVYAAFLLYVGMFSGEHHPLTASLSTIAVLPGPNIYLPLALAGASLISFVVTHFQYLLPVIHPGLMPRP